MALTSTFTAPVAADAAAPQSWLTRYTAAAGCPGETAFRDALESRLGHTPERALGHSRLSVELSRSPGAQVWRGQLHVTDAAHLTTTRQVEDTSCEAVVHALTLIAALGGAAPDNEAPEPHPSESGLPDPAEAAASEREDSRERWRRRAPMLPDPPSAVSRSRSCRAPWLRAPPWASGSAPRSSGRDARHFLRGFSSPSHAWRRLSSVSRGAT